MIIILYIKSSKIVLKKQENNERSSIKKRRKGEKLGKEYGTEMENVCNVLMDTAKM